MSAPPIKKACDACHRRKVRCTGGLPCRNCGQASLHCTYLAIPQKKGPKGSRAKVISELRDTQQQAIKIEKSLVSPSNGSFDFNSSPLSPIGRWDTGILTLPIIESCLDFFFTHMYPTMPILNRLVVAELASTDITVDPEAFCFIASLCAWILIQPGMTSPGSAGIDGEPASMKFALATTLLEEIQRARKSLDVVENPSLLTVGTSFFLFGAYFSLEQQNHAWFHLRQASTVALILDMHEENSYTSHAAEDIYKRRFYWLLLLTERAYSMERRRPLTLHATIELPTVNEHPEEATIISGFLCLVNLFRPIDDDFIGLWNKSRSECSTSWLAHLQRQLTEAVPPNMSCTDSQVADICVTQQWLRIMVWQLSIMNGNLSSSSEDSSMTFQYPIEVARDLIHDLSALPQSALEVHGVGIIEKIFDVACTLTDVIALVPLDPSHTHGSGHLPSEYLNQFLELISRLRDGASRFLPLLLAKISENLPSMTVPMNVPLSAKSEYGDSMMSPGSSTQSVTVLSHSPLTPFSGLVSRPTLVRVASDPGLIFAGYSPTATVSESRLTPSGTPTTQMAQPIPRSVPRFQFEGYAA